MPPQICPEVALGRTLGEVRANLHPSGAIKSDPAAGKVLTLALQNLSLHLQVTASGVGQKTMAQFLLILGQTRMECGLPLWLGFSNEQFGFDVVPKDDILCGVSSEGIVGKAWLLVDDILKMDQARVALQCLKSSWFSLENGIAQGHKASV